MALQFIVQTPRAGQWNHRLLISPQSTLSEEKILNYIAEASSKPLGKDYFAVSHTVRQTSTGREGEEILILVGIAADKLMPIQKEALQKKLQTILEQLNLLVTTGVDWVNDGKSLLVMREELESWVQKLDLPIEWLYQTYWQRLRKFLRFITK